MRKIYCGLAQMMLLIWFFLDMTGLRLGNDWLVTVSYKEDGIFFFIYLATLILFFLKEQIGKWFNIGWLSIWFIVEFMSHEWYTFFGSGLLGTAKGKIRYFSNTIQWLKIEGRYVPDVYHIILHLLILFALVTTVVYVIKHRKDR